MNATICHFCLQITESFSINGFIRAKNGKFLCYRLCQPCAQKLFSINTYSDKQGRHIFLNTVKENAKIDALYVDNIV